MLSFGTVLNLWVEGHCKFGHAEQVWNIMKVFRHGDLLIAPVAAIPPGGRVKEDMVLARGEATGHAHRLESRGPVELWEFSNEIYFRLGADGGEVMHEEHKAIQLQPGAYRVWKQRQYEPQGARARED